MSVARLTESPYADRSVHHTARFWRHRKWASEAEAKASIKRRIEQDNERYAGMFASSDTGVIDKLEFKQVGKSVAVRFSEPRVSTRQPAPPRLDTRRFTTVDLTEAQLATLKLFGEGVAFRGPFVISADRPSESVHQSAQANYLSYEVLPGVHAVPLRLLHTDGYENEQSGIAGLAAEIRDSGKVSPVFIGLDLDGTAWTIEGQHRVRALTRLGFHYCPCLVVAETGR